MTYAYPAALMANTFSVTGLMILLGLCGKPVSAADFGIVHGATTAVLYSFSANARSIILNPSSAITSSMLLGSRLLLLLPLGLLSLWLSLRLGSVEFALAAALVLRRCAEWLAEVHLSEMELAEDSPLAGRFLLLQSVLFAVAAAWLLAELPFGLPVLVAWATSPVWLSVGYVLTQAALHPFRDWQRLLPHFGSTAVIGISVYVFRLLILLLVGKAVAGDLFTAFAIGGLLGSVFAQAIGPTLALQASKAGKASHFPAWLAITLAAAGVIGIGVYAAATASTASGFAGKSLLFWQAAGASLAGGAVMVLAQRFRLRLLQNHADSDVFGPDVMANILIVAAVPYVFYLLGVESLAFLYLLSAILAMLFYASAEKTLRAWEGGLQSSAPRLTVTISVLLLLPLFLLLDGSVFRDTAYVFDTGGLLSRLPVPVSVLACYGGIVLLGRYTRARLSLTVIFATFALMLTSSVLLSHVHAGQEQAKLILLIQFVLPMFALVLGQALPQGQGGLVLVARSFLWILAILVPLQLLATWTQSHLLLTPYLYLFSIYQHLQYVPMAFVAAYLIALYTLWNTPGQRRMLLWLGPLMGLYAGASVSALAVVCLIAGVFGLALMLGVRNKRVVTAWLLAMVVALCCSTYFSLAVGKFGGKYDLITLQTDAFRRSSDAKMLAPRNLVERITYWKFYSGEILSSPRTAALGHVTPPERTQFPSAHNYYLDFAYNFGIVPLLPLLGLLGLTVVGILRQWPRLQNSLPHAGLAAVVLFVVIVDNSFKVGMRQPYPGILTFFLWGLLLAWLFPVSHSAYGSREVKQT
ncbi:MAG: hypothetical protein KF804_07420 [Burkholderiales bacterium]|nr:hypothetical protein [Burkholderiales bacterium]